jgi:soluble lytic murein transglycosylase
MSKQVLRFALASTAFALVVTARAQPGRVVQAGVATTPARPVSLLPTAHPVLPDEPTQFWLSPDRSSPTHRTADAALSAAIKLEAEGEYAGALQIVSQSTVRQGTLSLYALYHTGIAQLRLSRTAEAREAFQAVQAQKPVGYLAEAAALSEAEAAETLNDHAGATAIYERVLSGNATNVEDVLMRFGRAAKAAGQLDKAVAAYSRVYYEFPLSEVAPTAGSELNLLSRSSSGVGRPEKFKLDLGRAERLFAARQYPAARSAFEALHTTASGDDRDLIELRLAESDQYLKRSRIARDGIKRFIEGGPRQAEALHFYAMAVRDLGDRDESVRVVRRIVDEFPAEPWAEEALNALGGYYVVKDEDDLADAVFRELCEKYPRSRYSERAAWKVGWRAYRAGNYADATRYFEQGAADFPRSDYRPAWLYWSARAHENLNEADVARERYLLEIADYRNSYYGRLAERHLGAATPVARAASSATVNRQDAALTPSLPPNATIVRALLSVQLYDEAINELRYAQKNWGDSSPVMATIAWAQRQQARSEAGSRRFQLLRGAINGMRRAYPQFLAANGENIPRELVTVIFPIAYWDLIRRYAAERELDPYFVAALVVQESTFVADIRSKANAVGLMQLMPATARAYATKLSLRYTPQLSTEAEANIRMGTAYLADKIREFGDLHLALASYNAGERAVRRWINERPGLERDEFIDDIPYPETQNYVKRVLGMADDYRRLYGDEKVDIDQLDPLTPKAASVARASSASETASPTKTSKTQPPARKRPAKPRKSA